jgi:ribosome-dependent ATPase
VQGLHQQWLMRQARERGLATPPLPASVETRYRYNPDVRSLPAIVPAVIPLLLLMLPAMLTALAVVREKELGSIVNLYVTPTTRTEFLVGKQLPYVALALLNFVLMCGAAVTVFHVPVTGSFAALLFATLLYVLGTTAIGLLASALVRSQIAAMFFTMIGTLLPAVSFAGLLNPVSSLEGVGRAIGTIYPASYMFAISRGVFNKGLGLADLGASIWPMALAYPVVLAAAIALLKKQER